MLKRALNVAAIVHATMGQGIVWSNGNTYVGTRVYSTDPRIPPNSKAAIQYLGIPFAAPPVGANRFKAPQLYQEKRENTRINLTESGKPCYNGKDNSQEDCLYLNLFKPDGVPWDEPIPVMVYLHGGGFTDGRADIYNGTEMAIKNNVIVVVPGYRVGMLGFFASNKSLDTENTTGNWGILDQRAALRWVQKHIRRFCGDPTKVVLFGQSAGAMSVAAHLISHNSHEYFHAAILSSPTVHSSYFFQSKEDSFAFSDWAAKTLAGCEGGHDLDCLRKVPVSRFNIEEHHRDMNSPPHASRLFPYMPWGLTIDGSVIKGTPLEIARLGKAAKIPVILGVTEDEGSSFALILNRLVRPRIYGDIPAGVMEGMVDHILGDPALTAKLLKDFNSSWVPQAADESKPVPTEEQVKEIKDKLLAEFTAIGERDISEMTLEEFKAAIPTLDKIAREDKPPAAFDKNPFSFFVKTLRDSIFACPSIDFAQALSQHNPGDVWLYNFGLEVWADTPWTTTRLADGGISGAGNLTFADLGAYHGAEIPFIFNLFPNKTVMPADLSNSGNSHMAFTHTNFCPIDSFKRDVADKIGCMWTNMGKCGKPQCENNNCGVAEEWEPWKQLSHHMDIHSRGEFTMRLTHEKAFPSPMECRKWHDRRVPFHNFLQQAENKTQPLSSMYAETAKGLRSASLTGILVLLVSVLVAI